MSGALSPLGLRTAHWAALGKPAAYRKAFKAVASNDDALLELPLRRQMKTARSILSRLQTQKGVMLADDVGLGKTRVAALVACVFSGGGKKVRILAPNATMARRWREEVHRQLEVIDRLSDAVPGLEQSYLRTAAKNVRNAPRKLHAGHIRVTTHLKGAQRKIDCDLLIVDEAHRARSENSQFGEFLRVSHNSVGRVLLLTATPFSLGVHELSRALTLVGADHAVIAEGKKFGKRLQQLWSGEFKDPTIFGQALGAHRAAAIKALKPWVIRHSVTQLGEERKHYGQESPWPIEVEQADEQTLEILVRTDRLLRLRRRAELRSDARTNDPRFHQGWGHVRSEIEKVKVDASVPKAEAAAMDSHQRAVTASLSVVGTHIKIARTVEAIQSVLNQGEKVLVFCDHHAVAQELTEALARGLDVPRRSSLPTAQWRSVWRECLTREWPELESGGTRQQQQLAAFVDWLSCGL